MSDAMGPAAPEGRTPRTAFVLGGGGVLGASQVGMLRALFEAQVRPDVIVGTSVGAVNGAFVAAEPTGRSVERLAGLWGSLAGEVFTSSLVSRAVTAAKHRTHLHSAAPLRALLRANLSVELIEDLAVRFQCVAASIERGAAHWFSSGPLVDAVVASCAVPGLLPPAYIGGEHFYDGGLVDSVPVGRAIALGAREVFVLHVGRMDQPLRAPRWPWEVGLVTFELARRHRFVEAMSARPDDCRVHVLPTGQAGVPSINVRYAAQRGVGPRIEAAYQATRAHLEQKDLVR